MTQLWGPLGWMTLHSISLNYPDTPSDNDKAILKQFMNSFADCISCPSCKTHFLGMFSSYIRSIPSWCDNRSELFIFIARAHNTVNKRLDKPLMRTVDECIQAIRSNSKNVSLREFRQRYIAYLGRNWSQYQNADGRFMMASVLNLQKINNEYWNLRESVDMDIPEADVLQFIEDRSINPRITGFPAMQRGIHVNVGFKFSGGRLTLNNR